MKEFVETLWGLIAIFGIKVLAAIAILVIGLWFAKLLPKVVRKAMPDANGYEICSQLRKLSFFRTIPIIILTGNDGIIDRVRAKMVGSSDFLSKPIDAEIVLNVVQKYLKHPSPT